MKKFIALFLMTPFFLVFQGVAQNSRGGTVGFSCSFFGTPSNTVTALSKKVRAKEYNEIKKLLLNGTTAEKYLAVVLCETLEAKALLRLTAMERDIVWKSYSSKDSVSICAGCTFLSPVPIGELLANESKYAVARMARDWSKKVMRTREPINKN